jgi:hypothetical protein
MLEFSAEKSFEKSFFREIPRKILREVIFRGKKYEKSTPDEFSVLAVTMIPLQHVSHAPRAWSG